jgi:hypothetical protein
MRKPVTPRSQIKSALHRLWLRSRERHVALKNNHYSCWICEKHHSRAKGREVTVEVHHVHGINWDEIIDHIYRELLVGPDKLLTLCECCHEGLHRKQQGGPHA